MRILQSDGGLKKSYNPKILQHFIRIKNKVYVPTYRKKLATFSFSRKNFNTNKLFKDVIILLKTVIKMYNISVIDIFFKLL